MSALDGLIERAFATRALIPAKDACDVLGLDEKTFRALVEAGAIRSVLVGQKTRRFAEQDLRAFISGETALCPSTSQPVVRTGGTISNTKVVGFTEARAKRLAEKRKASNGRSALRRQPEQPTDRP